MARNPNDDVAEAIATRWATSAALVTSVPGGLEHDRLTEAQPNVHPPKPRALPYAKFTVSQLQEPERSTCNRAIHHQHVVIEIRGLKADVSAALEILWRDPATKAPVFVRQTLPMARAEGSQAMAVLEMKDEVTKDEVTKDAEDLWVGNHELHVMVDRAY